MTKTKTILALLLMFLVINSCKKAGDYVEDDNYIQLNLFATDSSNIKTFEKSIYNPLNEQGTIINTDYDSLGNIISSTITKETENIIINNISEYNNILFSNGYCLKPEIDFDKYYVIGVKGPDNMFMTSENAFVSFEPLLKKSEQNFIFEITTTQFSENKPGESFLANQYCILWFTFPKNENGSKVLVNQKYEFKKPDDNNFKKYCGDYKGYVKSTFSSSEMNCTDTILTLKLDKPQLPNNNYEICRTPIIYAEYDNSIAGYSYAYKINNIIQLIGSCTWSMFGNTDGINYIDISNNTIVITLDCGIFYGKKI